MIKIIKISVSSFIVALGGLLIVTQLPTGNSFQAFSVLSGSMSPSLPTGSLVFTQKADNYQEGNIITFQSGKEIVTHRLTKIDPQGRFMTKGDANEEADSGVISSEAVLGKVVFSLPFLGWLANILKTPQGFIFLIVIPGALLIYEEIKTLKKDILDYLKRKTEEATPPPSIVILLFLSGAALSHLAHTQAYFLDVEASGSNVLVSSHTFSNLYDSNAFTCPEGAQDTTDPAGNVSFTFAEETFDLKVVITDGNPNTSYDVWINQDPGACPLSQPSFPDALTTNSQGQGEATFNSPREEGATRFWISAVGGIQVLRSVAIQP